MFSKQSVRIPGEVVWEITVCDKENTWELQSNIPASMLSVMNRAFLPHIHHVFGAKDWRPSITVMISFITCDM